MEQDKNQEAQVENPVNENVVEDMQEETTVAAEPSIEEKLALLNDSHLRLMADFDNYRKRTIKEKADLIKNAGERVIVDLLPIIDNFERALQTMETAEDVAAVKEGVELIYNQVQGMMKKNGVEVIATENLALDTELHEAITTIPAPTPELKDKIVDCTSKGYTMNDKVIRHAKVVVGQ